MAGPSNPFAAIKRGDAATGRGRGNGHARGRGGASPPRASHQDGNGIASRGDARFRGRGRGDSRGNGRGGPGGVTRSMKTEPQQNKAQQVSGDKSKIHKKTTHSAPARGKTGKPDAHSVDSSRDPRKRNQSKQAKEKGSSDVAMRDTGSYADRYDQLKAARAQERKKAIKDGQMADPDQPTSLTQAITPVGTCTSMCPEFERVERIVQKMVDKSEKYLNPKTDELEYMETMMLKRFRRSAAGYDEQLPSDIRTPYTLLQSMNYLTRHVVGGPEPLGLIHKFVWDRTRSIRNDFSVQQLTQVNDVKIAVTCLERIARFHILSLHLLSSPTNEEHFDHHQEREQLNNTMLSLMYYYDDNRGRIYFPNEDEFRAYYIIFSILDQRPDLEARVQRWPIELRQSSRVQVALELHAAASNTWESQGTLDAKRPNSIAQGFYTRFFNLIDSPAVSYLMGCVAEIYFNHVRQTAIQSIWKAYCRQPASQRHKNEEWTVSELTTALCFDQEDETVEFCQEQNLEFAENENGELFLNWGTGPDDSDAFQPSSSHSFSEYYVESKRKGRTLVAIILGLNIKEAAILGMIDTSLLEKRSQSLEYGDYRNEESLFVSDDDNDMIYPDEAKSGPRLDSPTSASSHQKAFDGYSEASVDGETRVLGARTDSSHLASLASAPLTELNPPAAFNSPGFATSPQPLLAASSDPPEVFHQPPDVQLSEETPASHSVNNRYESPFASLATPVLEDRLSQQPSPVNPALPLKSFAAPDLESNSNPGLTAGQPSSVLDGVKSGAVSWGTNATFTFPGQTSNSGETSDDQQPQKSPPKPAQISFTASSAMLGEAKPTFTFPSQASTSVDTTNIPQSQNPSPKTEKFSFSEPSVITGGTKPAVTFPSQVSNVGDTKSIPKPQDTHKPAQFSFSIPPASSGGANTTFTVPGQTSDSRETGDSQQPQISPSKTAQISFSAPPAISGETRPSFTFTSQTRDPDGSSKLQNPFSKPVQVNFPQPSPTSVNPFAPKTADATPTFSFTPHTVQQPNKLLSQAAVEPQPSNGPTMNEGSAAAAIQAQTTHGTHETPHMQELPRSRNLSTMEESFAATTSQTSTTRESLNGQQSYLSETATSNDSIAPKMDGQQPAWLTALREAAEKRRESVHGRKRVYNPEEETMDNGAKPSKASKPESLPPPKKSLAQTSVKPLPKLPILEQIEELLTRRPAAELELDPPRRSQIDEDEMLLSAARIAAESLRGGPRLSDSFSTYSEPRHSFSPRSSLNSSYSVSRSQSPQTSFQVNGYDVAFAPETEPGLGRSMSRTEQRIRATGGRGLAYKPLDFTPKKQRKTQ